MTIRTDPEWNETAALFDLVDLDGVEVRLGWRGATGSPRHPFGVDCGFTDSSWGSDLDLRAPSHPFPPGQGFPELLL